MAAFKQLNEAGEKSHNHNDWLCFMTTNHRGAFSAAQESYYNLACYFPEEIEVIEENFHVCPFTLCQITCIHLLCIPFFHSRWAIRLHANLNTGSHPLLSRVLVWKWFISLYHQYSPLHWNFIISIQICFIFHEEKPSFSPHSSQATASFFCSHDSKALPHRKYCVFSLPPFHFFHI